MKKDRGFYYNTEQSPDDERMTRFHFLVIDDKWRKKKIDRVLAGFRNAGINYPFEEVRVPLEGKVKGTEFRYVLISYDSLWSPAYLNFGALKNVFRERELYERKKGTLEDFVVNQLE